MLLLFKQEDLQEGGFHNGKNIQAADGNRWRHKHR